MKKTLLAMAALAAISGSVLAADNAQVPATPAAQGVQPYAAGQTMNGYTDGQAYYNEHGVRMGQYMQANARYFDPDARPMTDKMAENKDMYPNMPPQVAPKEKQDGTAKEEVKPEVKPMAKGVQPYAPGQTMNGYTDGQAYYNEHGVRMGQYMQADARYFDPDARPMTDKMAENKDMYPNVPPQVAPEKKQENSEKNK
ncbi:hypothetical protein [Negativicoccus succinicivorans]|uniref:hypothetical protein n=1 Tax=Negativicoccus succinicivorans TaxID=620903 RepID=UPI002902564E|nr:hypothetical protein [Negativicoccus succinicivorans]MDU2417605.1 hypothetical protein [Negativicoccus succinicivorans]